MERRFPDASALPTGDDVGEVGPVALLGLGGRGADIDEARNALALAEAESLAPRYLRCIGVIPRLVISSLPQIFNARTRKTA